MEAEEAKWIAETYVAPASPGLILGCGPEQKKLYKERNPGYREAGKERKRSLGILLLCIGGAFLLAMLINYKMVKLIPASIMTTAFLAGGGVLLYLGTGK